MALGREVGDAYIEVHADLDRFRDRLRREVAPAARKAAEGLDDAFKRYGTDQIENRWKALTRALYTDDKIDWEKVVGEFGGFDRFNREIRTFTANMKQAGRISQSEFDGVRRTIENAKESLRIDREVEQHERELRGLGQAYRRMFGDIKDESNKFVQSLRNVRRAKDQAFKSSSAEWDKEFRAAEKAAQRAADGIISEAHRVNREYDRVTREYDQLTKRMYREAIQDQKEWGRQTEREAERAAKAAQRAFENSFDGKVFLARMRETEREYSRIVNAIANDDWSGIRRNVRSLDELRDRVDRVGTELRDMGRISDSEFRRMRDSVRRVVDVTVDLGNETERTNRRGFNPMRLMVDKLRLSWARMDSTVRLVLGFILTAGDQVATLGSGIAGSFTAVASSLGMALANVVPLAGAVVALGAGAVLAAQSMDEIRERTAGIEEAFSRVSSAWQQQIDNFAAQWGPALRDLANTAADVLGNIDIGAPLGRMLAGITEAFQSLMTSPGFTAFLDALQNQLPAAGEAFGRGLASVIEGLGSLIAGAAPAAQALGELFQSWADGWANSMERMRQDGTLAEVFDQAIAAMRSVGDLTGPLLSAITGIFRAGSESGNIMLQRLGEIVQQFSDWTRSIEGQNALREWFSNAMDIMSSMSPMLAGLGEALASLVTPDSIARFSELMSAMGELLPIVANLLHVIGNLGILNILVEALVAVGQAIDPLLQPMMELANVLGGGIRDAIAIATPLFAALGQALAPLIPVITGAVQVFLSALLPALQQVTQAFMPLIDIIGQVAQIMADAMMQVLPVMAPAWRAIGDAVGTFAGVLGELLTALAPVITLLAGTFAQVLTTLAPIVANIVTQIAQLAAQFLSQLLPALMPLVPVLMTLANAFAAILIPAVQLLGNIVQAVFPIILSIIQAVLNNVIGLIQGLVTVITGVTNVIRGIFTGDWAMIWEGLKQIVSGAVQAIWNFIQLWIVGRAVQAIRAGLRLIQNLFRTVWNAVSSTVRSVLQSIGNFIRARLDAIRSTVNSVLNAIRNLFSSIWNAISSRVSSILRGIGNTIRSVLNSARSTVTSILRAIRSAFTNALSTVRSAVSSAMSSVRSAISSAMSSVRSTVSSAFSSVVSSVRSAISSFVSTIRSGVSSAVSAVRSMGSSIYNAVVSLGSRMYNAGRNIISSIANGIRSAISSVTSAIGSAVQAIRDFLPFSPAKRGPLSGRGYTLYSGQKLITDMAEGMNSRQRRVAEAASAVMAGISAEFNHSKMFIEGRNAALGLADGLEATRNRVGRAWTGLGLNGGANINAQVGGGFSNSLGTRIGPGMADRPAERLAGPSKVVHIESGAIRIEAPQSDSSLVAKKTVDEIAERVG